MEQDAEKQDADPFASEIAGKEKRKIKAQHSNNDVWSGLGMMGMVGWSVVVPTLLGAAAGFWLDRRYPQTFSWTLTLLLAGLVTGSVVAWYWVDKEDKELHATKEEEDE